MDAYEYIITPRALSKMRSFYKNVARKYRHTYDLDDMERNIHDAVFAVYGIERTLARRRPALARWQGWHMANSGQWYYAYRIDGDTIIVEDSCHEQNMHD